jgi:hypothetical protein
MAHKAAPTYLSVTLTPSSLLSNAELTKITQWFERERVVYVDNETSGRIVLTESDLSYITLQPSSTCLEWSFQAGGSIGERIESIKQTIARLQLASNKLSPVAIQLVVHAIYIPDEKPQQTLQTTTLEDRIGELDYRLEQKITTQHTHQQNGDDKELFWINVHLTTEMTEVTDILLERLLAIIEQPLNQFGHPSAQTRTN